MRISDWSSDVCSSDLHVVVAGKTVDHGKPKPCIGTFADKPRQRGPSGRGIVNSSTQLAQLLGKRGKQRNGVAIQAQAERRDQLYRRTAAAARGQIGRESGRENGGPSV